MKISSRQAHILTALLQSSLTQNVIGYLCFDHKQRQELLDDILNQQSRRIVDTDEENEK